MSFAAGFKPVELSLLEKLRLLNWPFVLVVGLVALVGYGTLYSAGGGAHAPWAWRHGVRFGVGLGAMLVVALIDIRFWFRCAYVVYGAALLGLIAVEFAGQVVMGAQRWLDLGLFQLQPSEVMKIALVMALARYFHSAYLEDVARPLRLTTPLVLALLPATLVLKQPDLGTSVMLLAGAGALFFLAGVRWSKIALGSGGLWGKGFLEGTQSQLSFLPEKQTDFVFTMLAEEAGLIGALGLLFLLLVLVGYGFVFALRARNHFGRLLATGIATTFCLYVVMNVAMVTGLVPVVGVPLPMISYGGTAMMTVLFGFGLMLGVDIHRDVAIPRFPVDHD